MIELIKKLPSEKIGTLIELIKAKLKDILISNNKCSQKLFELCNADQRMKVLTIIKEQLPQYGIKVYEGIKVFATTQ